MLVLLESPSRTIDSELRSLRTLEASLMAQQFKGFTKNTPMMQNDDLQHRISFCSSVTSDRLLEAARRRSVQLQTLKTDIKKERRSVFKELGLENEEIGNVIDDIVEKPLQSPPLNTLKKLQLLKHRYR